MNALDVTARALAVSAASSDGLGTVPISNYGVTGTHDDSLIFQAAIDDLDGTGKVLGLVGPLNLRGTVYLGDNAIRFNGWPVNCLIDEDFTERAAIPDTMEAVIGTKSGWYTTYANDAVSIDFLDPATFNVVRTVDTGVAMMGIKLEGTKRFSAGQLTIATKGTGKSKLSSLDFFQGVEGVRIETLELSRQIGPVEGGFWIRNFASWIDTCDISIGRILFSGDGIDEQVAIFNSGGDPDNDVHDVHIGEIVGTIDGGSGYAVSIYRGAGNFDPAKMRNISVGRIKVTINSLSSGPSSAIQTVRVGNLVPSIGEVSVDLRCAFPPGMTAIAFLRGPPQGSQPVVPKVHLADFRIDYPNSTPSSFAACVYGSFDIGTFRTGGTGTGFKNAGYALRSVSDAQVADVSFNVSAFDGAESVTGYVEGKMINVYNFRGIHVIDCDRMNANFWWYHNSTAFSAWNYANPTSLSYDAEVRIRGGAGKSVNRIVFVQSSPENSVPVSVRYRASNPGSLAISNADGHSGKAFFPTGQYDAVIVNGGTPMRRGRTTTLLPTQGAVTPVFEYHLLNSGADITDVLGPNGGAPYDGQIVRLRMNGGTGTLRHGSGAAGTKIVCRSGADTIVPAVGWCKLSYNASAARWETDT